MSFAPVKIGLISVSDRASTGVYEDKGIPALQDWLASAMQNPIAFVERLIADEQPMIESALIDLCDIERCDLVLTTGGTGPARRDVTPEATLAAMECLCLRKRRSKHGQRRRSGQFLRAQTT